MSALPIQNLKFVDSPSALNNPDRYTSITVSTLEVLKSWRLSIYSFEWIDSKGVLRDPAELSETDRAKRLKVESDLQNGASLEKPVLGIGIQDNVEIGAGKALFMTLSAHGLTEIPVNILKSNEKDFKAYLAKVG